MIGDYVIARSAYGSNDSWCIGKLICISLDMYGKLFYRLDTTGNDEMVEVETITATEYHYLLDNESDNLKKSLYEYRIGLSKWRWTIDAEEVFEGFQPTWTVDPIVVSTTNINGRLTYIRQGTDTELMVHENQLRRMIEILISAETMLNK